MLCLLITVCLFGSSLARTLDPTMLNLEKPASGDCSFGFYGAGDSCCHFYQCVSDDSADGAYRRSCMVGTWWNPDTWTCDTDLGSNPCDQTNLTCWDNGPAPVDCDVTGSPNQCCELPGADWSNRQVGFGEVITFFGDGFQVYEVCGRNESCPEGSVFSGATCSCSVIESSCDCLDWQFAAADYNDQGDVADQNQDTLINLNGCSADTTNSALVCNAGNAALEAYQKAYYGKEFVLAFEADSAASGVLFANGAGGALAGATLSAEVNTGTLTLTVGGATGTVSVNGPYSDGNNDGIVQVLAYVANRQLYLYIEGNLVDQQDFPYTVQGSDYPLYFGQGSVTFYRFALCHYYTSGAIDAFFQGAALPANPH